MLKLAAIVAIAVLTGVGYRAWAQVRPDVRTTVSSISSSSSNGVSFAWFYDATERTVYLCRAGQESQIDCKARTVLP